MARSADPHEIIADSEEEEGRSQPQPRAKSAVVVSDDEAMADADDGEGDSGDENESDYEVEAILDHQMGMFKPNEYAYFVSWKGYDSDENSWVSQSDAGNAMELIEEYWKHRPKKEVPKMNGGGKKRQSYGGKRESTGGKRQSTSGKRESVGSTKAPTAGRAARNSVSKLFSDDSEIEVIDGIDDVKPAAEPRRQRKSPPPKATRVSALVNEVVSDDDDELLRPTQRAKSNGKSSSGKKVKTEHIEVESDNAAGTAVDDEDDEDYPQFSDMEPYMDVPNWEQLVASVDTVEQQTDGGLRVYLTLDDGRKASHDSSVVRQRCPQKLITFYESHLRWRQPRA